MRFILGDPPAELRPRFTINNRKFLLWMSFCVWLTVMELFLNRRIIYSHVFAIFAKWILFAESNDCKRYKTKKQGTVRTVWTVYLMNFLNVRTVRCSNCLIDLNCSDCSKYSNCSQFATWQKPYENVALRCWDCSDFGWHC